MEQSMADYLKLRKRLADLKHAMRNAEQTMRNLGNAALTGDHKQIALNEAQNMRDAIDEAEL